MLTTLDISSVTDRLLNVLTDAVNTTPLFVSNGGTVADFTIELSNSMPETVRNAGNCQLSLYLLHIAADRANRNFAGTGSRPQTNPAHPLALNLFYLVTAFAGSNATQEQQTMSIVLQAFHERATFVDPGDGFTFTITLEDETADEANRRWQSFNTGFRMGVVYRVSIVFLSPRTLAPAPAPPPTRLGLDVAPAKLPLAKTGQVFGTFARVTFSPSPAAPGDTIEAEMTPAVAVPGRPFTLAGASLDQPTATRVYLLEPGGTERNITSWRAGLGATASRIVLNLPMVVGTPPAASPLPGVYQLRVGSDTADGDALTTRSNSTPFSVAARVDTVASPIVDAAGLYTLTGAGFIPNETELLVDTVALTAIAPGGAPAAGQFALNAGATEVSFRLPAGLAAGRYFVRLRVRGVETPFIGWVDVP